MVVMESSVSIWSRQAEPTKPVAPVRMRCMLCLLFTSRWIGGEVYSLTIKFFTFGAREGLERNNLAPKGISTKVLRLTTLPNSKI